jgi:predicted nucleic acid-binding protein
MATQKIRAFLDTNVLLEYFRGKAELQHLFSEEVRERADFAINGIVAQELLLSRVADSDFAAMELYVEIVESDFGPSSPDWHSMLHDERNRSLHVNDILILATARTFDVLLTYNRELLQAANAVLRSETPEEFLVELGAAA